MKALLLLVSGLMLGPVSAAIVYSGSRNIPIPTTPEGIYLNLDLGTTATAEFTGWDINPFFGGYAVGNSAAFQPVRDGTANNDTMVTIPLATVIGPALTYSTGNGGSSDHMNTVGGSFVPGQSHYIGFRFTPDGGSSTFYGWLRVIFTINQPGGLIQDWAYENSGSTIQAGATGAPIPEPGVGLGVFLGGLLLLGRRRTRFA